jgi:S-adenosylmethionine/arginine decarboxylase-like enzyme
MSNDQEVLEQFKKESPWGLATAVDLKNCNPATIRNAEVIKQFVQELCDLIDMKRFGDTMVVHFGDDPRVCGLSMTQLIETSLISGHFANETNAVYLDIFSCKEYPPYRVADFCKTFFEAEEVNVQFIFRH